MKPTSAIAHLALFAVLAIGGCACDLYTKHWTFEALGPPGPNAERRWIIPGVLSLLTNLNTGALFGVWQGGNVVFTAASVLAVLIIGYLVVLRDGTRNLVHGIVLGLVMAGAMGNLYDRLGIHGLTQRQHANPPQYFLAGKAPREVEVRPVRAVRDFIYFKTEWIDWPIFNFADCFLVIGVSLLMLHSFFRTETNAPAPVLPAASPTASPHTS